MLVARKPLSNSCSAEKKLIFRNVKCNPSTIYTIKVLAVVVKYNHDTCTHFVLCYFSEHKLFCNFYLILLVSSRCQNDQMWFNDSLKENNIQKIMKKTHCMSEEHFWLYAATNLILNKWKLLIKFIIFNFSVPLKSTDFFRFYWNFTLFLVCVWDQIIVTKSHLFALTVHSMKWKRSIYFKWNSKPKIQTEQFHKFQTRIVVELKLWIFVYCKWIPELFTNSVS